MKTLFIARHAKSSWDDISVSDHNRDLIEVGVNRTRQVIEFLKNKEICPDAIISSSATRAFKTAQLLAEGAGFPMEKIKVTPTLYNCTEEDFFVEIYALPDEIQSVMLVGHNPAITDFSNYFLKRKEQIDNLPTSGIVGVKIKTKHWEKIHDVKFSLLFKAFPRKMK